MRGLRVRLVRWAWWVCEWFLAIVRDFPGIGFAITLYVCAIVVFSFVSLVLSFGRLLAGG